VARDGRDGRRGERRRDESFFVRDLARGVAFSFFCFCYELERSSTGLGVERKTLSLCLLEALVERMDRG